MATVGVHPMAFTIFVIIGTLLIIDNRGVAGRSPCGLDIQAVKYYCLQSISESEPEVRRRRNAASILKPLTFLVLATMSLKRLKKRSA